MKNGNLQKELNELKAILAVKEAEARGEKLVWQFQISEREWIDAGEDIDIYNFFRESTPLTPVRLKPKPKLVPWHNGNAPAMILLWSGNALAPKVAVRLIQERGYHTKDGKVFRYDRLAQGNGFYKWSVSLDGDKLECGTLEYE